MKYRLAGSGRPFYRKAGTGKLLPCAANKHSKYQIPTPQLKGAEQAFMKNSAFNLAHTLIRQVVTVKYLIHWTYSAHASLS